MTKDQRYEPSIRVLGLPVSLLSASLFAVLCLICAVVGVLLHDSRALEFKRASTEVSNLSTAITQDIQRNLETYDLSIQGVIDDLKNPTVLAASPALRQLVLFDRAATAPYLGAILVIDPEGNLVIDSRSLQFAPFNYADRDYFRVHAASADVGLFISKPVVSRSDGQWIIGLSRRVNKPDGSFGGVVVGTLHIEYFHQLFSTMKLGPHGALTLLRDDGVLLMREPFNSAKVGDDFKSLVLFKKLALAPEGEYQTRSGVDGVERLNHYRRVGPLPIVVNTALSIQDIYAEWWRKASVIVAILLLCCAVNLTLAIGLRIELRRRTEAEAALLLLAGEDSLTGIANRRRFDESLEREWRVAARYGMPLSLLMIDVDQFKGYNDTFGHPMGDAALAAIGACLKAQLRRPGELAARYGGEEFAVILPRMGTTEAIRVAEAVRSAVLALAIPHPASTCERLSVSIGVASLGSGIAVGAAGLVAAADAALYSSKTDGRNRSTVCTEALARAA